MDNNNSRKFVHAKRRKNASTPAPSQQRNNLPQNRNNSILINNKQDNKRGQKRPGSLSKNIANERLKKLRTALNDDVKKKQQQPSTSRNYHDKILQNKGRDSKVATKRPSHILSSKGIAEKRLKTHKSTSTSFFEIHKVSQNVPITFNFSNPAIVGEPKTSKDCNKDSEVEEMDVDMVEVPSNSTVITNFNFSPDSSIFDKVKRMHSDCENLYVVVDTNIFISHLNTIKSLVQLEKLGEFRPIVFIPWMVVEELDELKSDRLRRKVQEANRYLLKAMQENNHRIQGQTVQDAINMQNAGKSADDKILACCLQLKAKGEHLVLLTHDVNLKLKAQINQIEIWSHEEIVVKIKSSSSDKCAVQKSTQILQCLLNLFTTVINKFVTDAYGENYKHMDSFKCPPQTIEDCLNLFLKHWFAVFSEGLTKHCHKCLEDLQQYLKAAVTDLNELVPLSLRICVHMNDVENCKELVARTIEKINTIQEAIIV